MNFMGMDGDGVAANGMWGDRVKGWGRGNFCEDGVGMRLISTTMSLISVSVSMELKGLID